MTATTSKLVLPRRNFRKDDSNKRFFRNAVGASLVIHFFLFLLKMPAGQMQAPVKEKLNLPTKNQLLADLNKPIVGLKK